MRYTNFVIVIVMVMVALATPALAQNLAPQCDPALPPNQPGACDVKAFITWIKQVINFMFTIAIPLGVIFIVYGGFVIMTAGGSGDRVEKGKGIIKAAVIGLVIALSAYLIITALNFFIVGSFQFK
jgi:small-conductance mechanosensitive channel